MKILQKIKRKSNPAKQCSSGVFVTIRRYVGLLSKFLGLLVNLLRDKRVSSVDKAILGATVAYILNPADMLPDWVPFAGLVDDVYLVALALLRLGLKADEQVLKDNWKGRDDLIPLLRKVVDLAVAFLPARIRRAIQAKVDI